MPKVKTPEAKEILAMMNACRSYLYLMDILTMSENKKAYDRIRKYQDKNKIEITQGELDAARDRLFPDK